MAAEFPPERERIANFEPYFSGLPGLDVVTEAKNILKLSDWERERHGLSQAGVLGVGFIAVKGQPAPLDPNNLQPVTSKYEGRKRKQAIETLRLSVEGLIPTTDKDDYEWQGDRVTEEGDLYLLRRERYQQHTRYYIHQYKGYLSRYLRDDIPEGLEPSRTLEIVHGARVKLIESQSQTRAKPYALLKMAADIACSET